MTLEDRLAWWQDLRHEGLFLDTQRLRDLVGEDPEPLPGFQEQKLRRAITTLIDEDSGNIGEFVALVLEHICGFTAVSGKWQRGSNVPTEWSRMGSTGEAIRPRHLWTGPRGATLPVFIDQARRIGIGRGRRTVSQVLQWLRAGDERLTLLTNGRQWRLIFTGLDFHASVEWDIDTWFEEGAPSRRLTGLRSLLKHDLWIPEEVDQPPLLLRKILDSRKGQSELSAILGERVRRAVEILAQAHEQALHAQSAQIESADLYRGAVRVIMRLVVTLFAEARELLPADNEIYHTSYGIRGLRDQLERDHVRSPARLSRSYSAWPRLLALFRLIHDGCSHEALPVPRYGGELFEPGSADAADGVSRAIQLFETACFNAEVMSDREVYAILDLLMRTKVRIRQGRGSTFVPMPVNFAELDNEYIGVLYEGLLDYELRAAPDDQPVVFLNVGDQPALPLGTLEAMNDKALKALLEKMKDKKASAPDGEESDDDAAAEASEETVEATDDADSSGGDDDEVTEPDEGDASQDAVEAEGVRYTTRTRAETWARRACEVAGLVKQPRGRVTPEKRIQYDESLGRAARRLVDRVILPREWYLVRWGGTRKGSGTFYTKPQLAIPTVHRTLRPLAYNPPIGADGESDRDARAHKWTPKTPEAILALKVCDPACGSGSFPLAALRFLTEAVYQSVQHHQRLAGDPGRSLREILGLPTGPAAENGNEPLREEKLPCRPEDDRFEERFKAILRRYVVERCIYGVDLDPLAVELCRLALWIETMDRELPFSFLDHKFKCGNALVGCWFDRFRHYPIMAWLREGGDKTHTTGVHFAKQARTKAIAKHLKDVIKPDLIAMIDRMRGHGDLFTAEGKTAEHVHDEALTILEQMHRLAPGEDGEHQRATLHRQLRESSAFVALKRAFDCWCALWFWPADQLAAAPKPSTFTSLSPEATEVAERIARERRFFHWELEFPDVFAAKAAGNAHNPAAPGFDAVLGNPPWDTLQPNSKEWFSNVDPLFRAYGKQDALAKQKSYFAASEKVEREWLEFIAYFKDTANFVKAGASPFGDQVTTDDEGKQTHNFPLGERGRASLESSKARHSAWAKRRAVDVGYADPEHPFALQGNGKPYTYKLFTELALALLKTGGRLGFVVPSGLYTDHGSTQLRAQLLGKCRWEWLFGFENRDVIFDIHHYIKFNPVVVVKGGHTETIRTAFLRRDPDEWALGLAEQLAVPYSRAQIEQFSPKSKAIVEIRSARDLAVLEKIYANSVLLGDGGPEGWGIRYAQGDFNMSSDSKLFSTRRTWEDRGYRPDEYSRWIKASWRPVEELWKELGVPHAKPSPRSDAPPPYQPLPIPRADIPAGVILSRDMAAFIHESDIAKEVVTVKNDDGDETLAAVPAIALPLYQGAMIWQLNSAAADYRAGASHGTRWTSRTAYEPFLPEPQFVMGHWHFRAHNGQRRLFRIGFRAVQNATNKRTLIATLLPPCPTGHSVALFAGNDLHQLAVLPALLTSFIADSVLRPRMSQANLSAFVMDEIAVSSPNCMSTVLRAILSGVVLGLCGQLLAYADLWMRWRGPAGAVPRGLRQACTYHERLRLRCILDAIAAILYGVDLADLKWILRDCDYPAPIATNKRFSRTLDTKGYWRVDTDEPPERRHTVLTLAAFADLSTLIAAMVAAGGTRDDAIAAFCGQSKRPTPHVEGLIGSVDASEGWMLPEHFRLADLGLGHDDRAAQPQPVAAALGPRFYDWQLAQTPEESWRECHLHARNLLGESGYRNLLAEIEGKEPENDVLSKPRTTDDDAEPSLFSI